MQRHFICVLELAFLLLLMFGVDSSVENMKCYQCEVRESSLCTDEYLQTCPDNQAYDSCLTRIYKTKDDGPWIHKSCALAPCTLRDQSQSSGLGLDYCDRSQNEYDCVSCCKENGCNTGAGTIWKSVPALVVTTATVVYLMRKYGWL
ncbi:hypothetical protein JTE90_023942 [Oedothorax gibbosus]|uniref:Uncharacterized protein n=1 Tax=Oedothorax gibbosus TaxID=931172 RepID=A0AAV6TU31_9ARAC|nr:hypothetical protein JTE90_023942 [Oedothorax gibbosus]